MSHSITRLPNHNHRLQLSAPTTHADLHAERLHRKQRLAASYRLFAELGFEVGLAGHFTARDPIETDHYWINPLGVPFSQIRTSHLLRVNGQGRVVEGDGLLNTSALELHYELQKARPEVVGIAHLHGFHGRVWSSLGQLFQPITAESSAFVGEQVLFDRHALGNADRDLVAQAFVETFADNNLLVWQNHGLWTTGQTVESAAWRFILADDTARAHLLAYAAGQPRIPQVGEDSFDAAQRELFGWLNFLPLWDRIVQQQPDLLD
ncbi:class II aldolase/adducin family protein [Pseudomonas sp. GD04058]|uniref:class II aldolase/adducin family protein n=1 Tax=Pseudomonas sp. GD04058 TaxID=2975429 RepID=UPI0024493585|nr:class II aldolase/adducin family protein [Pseudomonas sp. GD04058]MDG9883488.1 class II aldolase/adducin family protein [Pseudomonas sp. GD04058]